MVHRSVWEAPIDILNLRPNIENQICNTFKSSRGLWFRPAIVLQMSDGERFIGQIRSLIWRGPSFLCLEGHVVNKHFDVEEASIELDLRPQQRNGELTVLNRIR